MDFWRTAQSREIKTSFSKSFSFQLRKNLEGIVCFRTKDAMHHTVWSPEGPFQNDMRYAPPLLRSLSSLPPLPPLHFVVPCSLPLSKLYRSIESLKSRLIRVRSRHLFPSEEEGEAYLWWQSFINAEGERERGMCSTCRDLAGQLAAIGPIPGYDDDDADGCPTQLTIFF